MMASYLQMDRIQRRWHDIATTYAAKKQGRSYNVSAIMAKSYAYHLEKINDYRDNETYLDGKE